MKNEALIRKAFFAELGELVHHPDVRRNAMTMAPNVNFLVAVVGGRIVGCVGWVERRASIKLKCALVLPEYRGRGIYASLCMERMAIIGRAKPIYAHCTASSIRQHLKMGAEILREYKAPSWKIIYRPIRLTVSNN